jgi:hypothetical protein
VKHAVRDLTVAECAILEIVLREVRHANALHQPVQVRVDPWVPPSRGAYVRVEYDLVGVSEEVHGEIGERKKPTRAARAAKRRAPR